MALLNLFCTHLNNYLSFMCAVTHFTKVFKRSLLGEVTQDDEETSSEHILYIQTDIDFVENCSQGLGLGQSQSYMMCVCMDTHINSFNECS